MWDGRKEGEGRGEIEHVDNSRMIDGKKRECFIDWLQRGNRTCMRFLRDR